VLQDDGVDASVSSGDEIGPTSLHEDTDARAESAADDYELPAGESNSIYYDYDLDLCVSAEPSDTVDENVVSSSLAGTVQQLPMWSKLNLSAAELAMFGRVPPLDLVSSGHLSAEESAISLWGQQFNISVAAQDRLQSIITAVDVNGRPTFDVSNVVKTEVQRRRVVDSLVPAHQRTARGNLFTDSACEDQLMRKNVVLDARHIPSIAIELLQEYEAHVDWELLPRYNDKGVRLFNEHFGSGDRAFRLNAALHAFDPDGVVVGLQFHSDKTAFGSKESLWPMYLTVFNIDPSVRKMQATRRLIAFFPILRGDWLHGKNRRTGQALWHMILGWVMEPLLQQKKTGYLFKRGDGTYIRIYLRLAALTCDLPEIALLLCQYSNSSGAVRPSPSCTELRVDYLKPTDSGECRGPLRSTDHMRAILASGDKEEAKMYSFTMEVVCICPCLYTNLLLADQAVCAQSTIWVLCDGTGIDAYELHDPDALHLFWAGMAKYAVKDTCIVLKRLGGEAALNELNRRAQSLLRCVTFVWRLHFLAPRFLGV
jgi:hypothetical protein